MDETKKPETNKNIFKITFNIIYFNQTVFNLFYFF